MMSVIPSFEIIINIWHLMGTEKRRGHIEALHSAEGVCQDGCWCCKKGAQGSEPLDCLLFAALPADLCANLVKPNSLPPNRSYNSSESPPQRHLRCVVTQPQLDFHYKGIMAFNLESRRRHVGVGDVASDLDLKSPPAAFGHTTTFTHHGHLLLSFLSVFNFFFFYSRNNSQIVKRELILMALSKK